MTGSLKFTSILGIEGGWAKGLEIGGGGERFTITAGVLGEGPHLCSLF